MYTRTWQQAQNIKTQEQSQEWWFSLGHSTAPKFWHPGEGSQVPPGSGQIPCSVKGTGEWCFLLQRESSSLTSFLLTRAGLLSLHVICPIFTYLSPADPRGFSEQQKRRGQFVWPAAAVEGEHSQGWHPQLAAGRTWDACQGTRYLTTLVLISPVWTLQHLTCVSPADPLPLPSSLHPWKTWKLDILILLEIWLR